MITVFLTIVKIIFLSAVFCEVSSNRLDNNFEICKNQCKHCGGVASYVDNYCECYINEENEKNAECVGRIRRQADDLDLDFANCKPSTYEHNHCNRHRTPGRLGINDIDLIVRYFMNGGPSKSGIRFRCDNSGQQFQSTTPVEQLLDEFTNEPLDCYDLSTPSNQIEDPYYEPEQPRTVKPYIPSSYTNHPALSSSPYNSCVYKCSKYLYPSASSVPISSTIKTTSSQYYPSNQLYSGFIKPNHLPSSSYAPHNPHCFGTPYAWKNSQLQPGRNGITDAIHKSIAEQNLHKTITNSQSWLDTLNSACHHTHQGGLPGSVIQQPPVNFVPLAPHPTQSPLPLDLFQLQTHLAQQNKLLEHLSQILPGYNSGTTYSTAYSPYNTIVGAPNPNMMSSSTVASAETTNSWSVDSSTPETYRPVPKTKDVNIQTENISEAASSAEMKSSLNDERSHRIIPIINRRLKREEKIEKLKEKFL